MEEENIRIEYETIGAVEQRNLIEMSRALGRAMTKEEYNSIMFVYNKVLDRLVDEAKKAGNRYIIYRTINLKLLRSK
ncbi:hypothetical protein [uncultured Clostridium sp.]|uniref:hypothetical protein n=1 Tax=uncultured Clostridium sp. TaxID=59620 RepID=UPI00262AFE96|nr:hypothetical protein [uncultured Clostridium sp.]